MTTNPSPFTEGTKIVVVHTSNFGDRSFNPATVTRVTPTGRFRIKYDHGHEPDKQFKPDFKSYANAGAGRWHGEEIGGSKYNRDHIEVRDEVIEAQIAAKAQQAEDRKLCDLVKASVAIASHRSAEDMAKVRAIAEILGIGIKPEKNE